MRAGYVIARENFKEAAKHVSAEADPVMFNLLYGLQSLADQIEADFAALTAPPVSAARPPEKRASLKPAVRPPRSTAKKRSKKARAKSR
ncbi:hypothetical protein [Rhodopseudomonas sp. P2A-2r]|uniref:hypothetical protein n=1 Tax=unclassified Rhodopseudomonas TaxID=2638247 RepID=UPI002234A107|nr:hypothetical protein [Rhodopseudomonas sp. P2A-2r]UZE49072.1 hypothetical protein ONR75_30945 [Rhodopseudomonas sp. P2A-2r]